MKKDRFIRNYAGGSINSNEPRQIIADSWQTTVYRQSAARAIEPPTAPSFSGEKANNPKEENVS
jgi:hypothetical protein